MFVGVEFGVLVKVGVCVLVGVFVGVEFGVLVKVGVCVGVLVKVGVCVGVCVLVGVCVWVDVGVGVGVIPQSVELLVALLPFGGSTWFPPTKI